MLVGMVITGHSYSTTIVAVSVTDTWKIVSDSVSHEEVLICVCILTMFYPQHCREVRLSPWGPREQLHGQTWLYLRFKSSAVYIDFNRVLWDVFWRVLSKAQLLKARLDDIGYARPSNFTRHCRQYLGDDYFDQLTDSEESEDDHEGTASGDSNSHLDWGEGMEGSGSEVGSCSEATAIDGFENA